MNKDNVEYLAKKHTELHTRIEVLEAEKAPDKYIQELKKEKLFVKDRLQKAISNAE